MSATAKGLFTAEGALVAALLLLLVLGIVYMQSAVGRGRGAALGVVAIVLARIIHERARGDRAGAAPGAGGWVR